MPTVFLYEQITALGLGVELGSPLASLHREGLAMRQAVERILANCGMTVQHFPGPIADEAHHHVAFCRAVQQADSTLVIAPETGGELARLEHLVRSLGGTWLGCTQEAIRLCTDKHRLAEHWQRHGIPTPCTTVASDRALSVVYPCVVKPIDGAGSQDTHLVHDDSALEEVLAHCTTPLLVQPYVPGLPVSVAAVVQPNAIDWLEPVWQRLSTDGCFHYLGGAFPLAPHLARRALALAERALACVPGLGFYVGIDMILGDAADGSADVAMEINPRFTTSIVGYEARQHGRIAALFHDQRTPNRAEPQGRIWFTAGGEVHHEPEEFYTGLENLE
jgi:hypothetical protein